MVTPMRTVNGSMDTTMSEKSISVQNLADKVKAILENPESIARIVAAQEAEDGSVSAILDELDNKITELERLYDE